MITPFSKYCTSLIRTSTAIATTLHSSFFMPTISSRIASSAPCASCIQSDGWILNRNFGLFIPLSPAITHFWWLLEICFLILLYSSFYWGVLWLWFRLVHELHWFLRRILWDKTFISEDHRKNMFTKIEILNFLLKITC